MPPTHNDRSLCRAWLYLNLNDCNVFRHMPSICVHIDIDASMQRLMPQLMPLAGEGACVRARVGDARACAGMRGPFKVDESG